MCINLYMNKNNKLGISLVMRFRIIEYAAETNNDVIDDFKISGPRIEYVRAFKQR